MGVSLILASLALGAVTLVLNNNKEKVAKLKEKILDKLPK